MYVNMFSAMKFKCRWGCVASGKSHFFPHQLFSGRLLMVPREKRWRQLAEASNFNPYLTQCLWPGGEAAEYGEPKPPLFGVLPTYNELDKLSTLPFYNDRPTQSTVNSELS